MPPGVVFLLLAISAAPHVRPAAAQSPTGTWEGEIEDPRRPTVITLDFTKNTLSLSGGRPTAVVPRTATGEGGIAFDLMIGGDTLRFSGVERASRIDGTISTGTENGSFWLEPVAAAAPPASRAEAWRQDIDAVLTRFLRYDRSFSEEARAATRARLERLEGSAESLPDQRIIVELARAVALSGNAHTRLYLLRNRTDLRRWPIRVWWFGDELRVVRAGPEARAGLGCRVTRIGDAAVEEAAHAVSDIMAGNPSWQRYMSSYFLTSPDILFGAGVIPSPDRVELTLACAGTTRRLELVPRPLVRSRTPVESWWDLAPAYPHRDAGFAAALPAGVTPRYLSHPDMNYWFDWIAEDSVLYFQYNRAQEMPDSPMGGFITSVSEAIALDQPRALIVDLRFNTGGDAGIGTPLVDSLVPLIRGIPVVVLTGRATFSAGITHAVQWKQYAGAMIVGEPVGDALDLWSEGGNLLLPNSELTVHYANGFHGYSNKEYPAFRPYYANLDVATLDPDVSIEGNWEDYLAGRDPLLDAALARVRSPRR